MPEDVHELFAVFIFIVFEAYRRLVIFSYYYLFRLICTKCIWDLIWQDNVFCHRKTIREENFVFTRIRYGLK